MVFTSFPLFLQLLTQDCSNASSFSCLSTINYYYLLLTFFLLVVNIVYAFFDTFGVIDATTQGGPAQDTQILVYKVYYDGVKAADIGGSSAQSVILMCIVIVLTALQFRFVERKVQY